jgi:hypothetical protein
MSSSGGTPPRPPRKRLSDRPVGEIIVLLLAVILASWFRPNLDFIGAARVISNVINTVIGALIGYLAGSNRRDGGAEQ